MKEILILHLVLCAMVTLAQTPANLPDTILYDEDASTMGLQATYANIGVIADAYNNAKRIEEDSFGLAPNSITDIVFPATWSSYCIDSMVLFILNHERSARGGLDYGDGACKGWTFEGIEFNMDTIAQSIADSCLAAGTLSFGTVPRASGLIDASSVLGGSTCNNNIGARPGCCHEHLPRYGTRRNYTSSAVSDTILLPFWIERVLYQMIYYPVIPLVSGGREVALLQDDRWQDDGYNFGFTDDHGPAGAEGFIAVGIASGPYGPGGSIANHADIFILNYFDSAPDAYACGYLPLTTCCDPILQVDDMPIAIGTYDAEVFINSSGLVDMPSVHFFAGEQICLEPGFEVSTGAMFLADIKVCAN